MSGRFKWDFGIIGVSPIGAEWVILIDFVKKLIWGKTCINRNQRLLRERKD